MPYICLANPNVPAGTLQITDLAPNVSQDNNPTNPKGQTKYLTRLGTDVVYVDLYSGVVKGSPAISNRTRFEGIGAYLLDRVEVGAGSAPTATLTLTAPQANDGITIKGVVFQFQAGNNDLTKAGTTLDPLIVGLGANANAAAANLTTALNSAAVEALMDATAPLNTHTVATNVGAPSTVVRIQVEDGDDEVMTGYLYQYTITVTNTVRIVPDNNTVAFGRLWREFEQWNKTVMEDTIDAIVTRLDAGQSMTLAAINTILLAEAGADLDGDAIDGSRSTGTLSEFLSILAGRKYSLPAGGVKFTPTTAPNAVNVWAAAVQGSFTEPVQTYGNVMPFGEWRPTTRWVKHGETVVGGDTVNRERRPIRSTYDSTALQMSIHTGQLARYAAGVTLFPDAEVQAHIAPTVASQGRQATLTGQRLVTVYDDDGSILA